MTRTQVAPDGTVTVQTDADASYEKASAVWDVERKPVRQDFIKSVSEKRYTLSMGYPAMLADVAVARDGHRDFANSDEVEKAAWGYMDNGREVGRAHADGTEGAGKVVESYLSPVDWIADNGQQVAKGDWLVGIVWSEEAWADIKAGKANGTSMQGTASRRAPNPADVARVKARRS